MITPVSCICGTPVVPDDEQHAAALAAVGAVLLCGPCDEADMAERQAIVDELEAERTTKRTAAMRSLLDAAGVPERSINAVLRQPPAPKFEPMLHQAAAFRAVTRWATDGGIVVLAGTKGTGKTTIAARGALLAIYHGQRVTWRPTVDIVSGLWANDVQVRDAAERLVYRGTGALVLDDLDVAKTTPAALETLGSLIDRWYSGEQPLLVTTNALSPGALVAKYGVAGERIASRLQSDDAWVDVLSDDLRTGGAA